MTRKKNGRKPPIVVADMIQEQFDLIFYGGEFWYCKNGCYTLAEMEIRNFLQAELSRDFSSPYVREILYALESRCCREKIDTNPHLINLKNGVYNWVEDRLYPHAEVPHRFFYQLPVKFNPEAKCPRIDQFLNEVLQPEDQESLLQFLGYSLFPSTDHEKAMMLVGCLFHSIWPPVPRDSVRLIHAKAATCST